MNKIKRWLKILWVSFLILLGVIVVSCLCTAVVTGLSYLICLFLSSVLGPIVSAMLVVMLVFGFIMYGVSKHVR